MKAQERSKGHRHTAGQTDSDGRGTARHAHYTLSEIGEQPPKAACRPHNCAQPRDQTQGFTASEHAMLLNYAGRLTPLAIIGPNNTLYIFIRLQDCNDGPHMLCIFYFKIQLEPEKVGRPVR